MSNERPVREALDSPLTIETAVATRDRLLSLISLGKRIELDVAAMDSIDVPGMQVLVAAFREARERGAPMSIVGPVASEAGRMIAVCGLSRSPCATGAELEASIESILPPAKRG